MVRTKLYYLRESIVPRYASKDSGIIVLDIIGSFV